MSLKRAAALALGCALAGTVLLFSQQFSTCFPPPKLFALTSLTAFAWAAALAARLTPPRHLPFTLPLLAALAWLGAGLARMQSPEAFTLVFLPFAGAAAAAWLAAALAVHPAERSRLLWAFVLAHLGCSVYAAVQYYDLDPWTWTISYGRGRVFSTIGNPNFLAGQLVLALPVLAALGFETTGTLRWLARAVFAIGLLAFICAQTRGAWIGLLAGTLVAAAVWVIRHQTLRLPVRRWGWLIAVITTLGFWYSIPALNRTGISLPSQLTSVMELEQQSARQRFFWWRGAIELFREAPLLGHGMGNFVREFPAHSRRVAAPYSDLYPAFCDHPHNDYLFVLCEHGVLGLGLLLWLGAVWLKVCTLKATRGSLLHLGVLAGAVGVAVHAVWNMPSVIQSTIFTAGCLLGLTAVPGSSAEATGRPADTGDTAVESGEHRPLALAAGLVIALLVAYRPAVLLTAQGYLNGARTMKEKRRHAPAAYLARQTLRITNAPWRTSFLLGGIMYGQRYYGEALKAFKQDERENPWGADAILHQAKALRQMERYDEADAQCRRALKLVPNYPEAAVTIASLAYFRANKERRAGYPENMQLHLRRARIWLTYALRFFPKHAEALKLSGFVEVMDMRWLAAKEAWERYLKIKPADADMRHKLQTLLADLPRLLRGGKPK